MVDFANFPKKILPFQSFSLSLQRLNFTKRQEVAGQEPAIFVSITYLVIIYDRTVSGWWKHPRSLAS